MKKVILTLSNCHFPLAVEIFESNKALWFNPTGTTLLYASFDDSGVGEVIYPWYAESYPYPLLRKLRYPKVQFLVLIEFCIKNLRLSPKWSN